MFAEGLGAVGTALQPHGRRTRPTSASRRRVRPCVLFLCAGNSARSQNAGALLRHRSAGTVDTRSAGSDPKALHPHAVRAMAERGIDIAGATTKHHRRFALLHVDRVVTLCDRVRDVCPTFPGDPTVAHWSTADPALEGGAGDASYSAFVRTADELDGRVGVLLAQLTPPQEEPRG